MIKLVECPRDAMQGIKSPIPTELKTRYLQKLLAVGFDTLDFGSFVSPKAVPQMADTAAVLGGLDLSATATELLAIVVNLRGAQQACQFAEIRYLGYPFSLSETFEQRNTRKSIAESVVLVREIQELCLRHGKELVLYFSMAFGNPYGDPWSVEIVEQWAEKMSGLDVKTISLADTAGTSESESIAYLFQTLIARFPRFEWGAHFHSHPSQRKEKLAAAWENGCRRFDTALMGYGGCPFAKDELVGNIATESLLEFCAEKAITPGIDLPALQAAQEVAKEVFLNTGAH